MKNRNTTAIPEYTYNSAKKEDIKVYRKIALILSAIFVILVIIFFAGTTFLNSLSVLSNGTETTSSNNTQTQLPLLVPKIDKLPTATSDSTISVSGETTSEVEVTLIVNDVEAGKIQADSAGNFNFPDVELINGLNLIKVIAKDNSEKTEEASTTITLDKTKPSLVITNPADGATFPKETKTISVTGTTEAEAIVYVNESQAVVDSSGKFSYTLPVVAGENQIEVKAIDAAGNSNSLKVSASVDNVQGINETAD